MEINLDFKYLDQLLNKLIAEHSEKDDILAEYELRKEELQACIDTQLSSVYGIISEYNEVEKDDDWCHCGVSIRLKKLSDAEFEEVKSIDITFCDEHDKSEREEEQQKLNDLQEVVTEEAHKLWLVDENAKFNFKYRKLFEVAEF